MIFLFLKCPTDLFGILVEVSSDNSLHGQTSGEASTEVNPTVSFDRACSTSCKKTGFDCLCAVYASLCVDVLFVFRYLKVSSNVCRPHSSVASVSVVCYDVMVTALHRHVENFKQF